MKGLKTNLIVPVIAVLILAVLAHNAYATTITGTATKCTAFGSCSYTISTSSGSGWATTNGISISFQLPGELKATYGQPYHAQHVLISGIEYNVTGSFVATDANNGKVVLGSTKSIITLVIHCQRGCTYTYTLVSGTITFTPTNKDPTSTTVTCNPSSFAAGGHTICKVQISDVTNSTNIPKGKVTFSSNSSIDTFTPAYCYLSSGSCSVQFTPNEEHVGGIPIYAAYAGNFNHFKSIGSTAVYVTSSG